MRTRCASASDAEAHATALATWVGPLSERYPTPAWTRRVASRSAPFADVRDQYTPAHLLGIWDDTVARAEFVANAHVKVREQAAVAIGWLAGSGATLDAETAALVLVAVPAPEVVRALLVQHGLDATLDAVVATTKVATWDPFSEGGYGPCAQPEVWAALRAVVDESPPGTRDAVRARALASVPPVPGLRAALVVSLFATLIPVDKKLATEAAKAAGRGPAYAYPLIAAHPDLAKKLPSILQGKKVAVPSLHGPVDVDQDLPRGPRADFADLLAPFAPGCVALHGDAGRNLLAASFRTCMGAGLAVFLAHTHPVEVACGLVGALRQSGSIVRPEVLPALAGLRQPLRAALIAGLAEPTTPCGARARQLTVLRRLAQEHADVRLGAQPGDEALPADVRRALDPSVEMRALPLELVVAARWYTPEIREDQPRLDIDIEPRQFRQIMSEDLDTLLDGWLGRIAGHLRRLLADHPNLVQEFRAQLQYWRLEDPKVRSLWMWARAAECGGRLSPAMESLVGVYADALASVIKGHFQGEYGHDHGIAFLEVAEVLVRAASPDGAGRNEREAAMIRKEVEAAIAR